MHIRCTQRYTKYWKNYGGRGVKVCQRWSEFVPFLEDMGPRPANRTLDRIRNSVGYRPSNCRWATVREQMDNRRHTVFCTIDGKRQSVRAWEIAKGLSSGRVMARVRDGWSVKKAILTPMRAGAAK